MILVDATGLGVARPDRPLFEDLSLTVASGDRIAVVGVNGTGKSTLLGALAGSRPAETGTIRRGQGARVSHLDQDAPLPDGTVAGVTGDRWEAASVRDRLGLTGLEDRPTDQLSGGQIKRVALARALLSCGPPGGGPADDADLLILDEPTNHLDVAAIAWLEEWLASYKGGLLLVTHDRHVLDRVTTKILELDRGSSHLHEGGYAGYLEAKAERAERSATAEAKRKNLAKVELAWLRRGAPARTSKPKARIETAEALVKGGPRNDDIRGTPMELHLGTPRLGDRVIEAHGVSARIDGRTLFEGLELDLDPRERMGIVGPNGAGKTTLLRILAGTREPDGGSVTRGPTVRLAHFSQDAAELDPSIRVRDLVTKGKKEVSWEDTALMERFWFDGDAQWAPVGTLSGGERRRLQLLLALQTQPNVLLLDEPTNDLDLDTLRILEDYLDEWPGALVVVSHDRALLERTVVDVVEIDGNGRAGRRAGGVAAHLADVQARRGRGKSTVTDPSAAKAARTPVAPRETKPAGRSPSTVRRELNNAERTLSKATAQVESLDGQLEAAIGDHEKLADLGRQMAGARAAVDEAEEKWLALAEEAEEVNPGLL
ncbi:MAG: ABC-F family ATP-binding cassette domain-containing protein [Acidimicrobiales bacterium]|nr:ABC-F family ATP-binding cassette domain-containing protein [Acidimicrobiales bacterium]